MSICEIKASLTKLVVEAAYISLAVKVSLEHLNPSPSQARTLDNFIALGMFATFLCTLITTVFIIVRIYPVTHGKWATHSTSQRFKHVVDILAQSAALYSLSALACAISSVLPLATIQNTNARAALSYSSPIFFCVAVRQITLVH